MTCIVGLKHKGKVYMGADSLSSTGGGCKHISKYKKVFKKGEMVIGFTSSWRMGQLLQYTLKVPYHKPGKAIHTYMVTDFVKSVKECFREGGYDSGVFLVGYRSQLFKIYGDFQVDISADDYSACGCGDDWAAGSLYSTKNLDPRKRIKTALEAASHNSTGVAPPFHIITI